MSNGEQDYDDGKDETQGVDGHTPLEFFGGNVLASLQGCEDETGEEGLQQLHYAGQRGEEPAGLSTRSKACQDHLSHIHRETNPRDHRSTNLAVTALAGEKGGVDDGGGQVHEARQYGKGSSEVIPGKRHFGADSGELQDENEKSEEEAEAPGEHAPYPVGRGRMERISYCCHQT